MHITGDENGLAPDWFQGNKTLTFAVFFSTCSYKNFVEMPPAPLFCKGLQRCNSPTG